MFLSTRLCFYSSRFCPFWVQSLFKDSTSCVTRKMQIETTKGYHLAFNKWVKNKRSSSSATYGQGRSREYISTTFWATSCSWRSRHPPTPVLSVYPQKLSLCTQMYMAALPVLAEHWKQATIYQKEIVVWSSRGIPPRSKSEWTRVLVCWPG